MVYASNSALSSSTVTVGFAARGGRLPPALPPRGPPRVGFPPNAVVWRMVELVIELDIKNLSISTHFYVVHHRTFLVEVLRSLRPSSLDCAVQLDESLTVQSECSSVCHRVAHHCTVSWPSMHRFVARKSRQLCLQFKTKRNNVIRAFSANATKCIKLTKRTSRSVIVHRCLFQWSKFGKELVDVAIRHTKVEIRDDKLRRSHGTTNSCCQASSSSLAAAFEQVVLPRAVHIALEIVFGFCDDSKKFFLIEFSSCRCKGDGVVELLHGWMPSNSDSSN